MNQDKDPYKVVGSNLIGGKFYTWTCKGPHDSGNNWNTEQEAQKECSFLNKVFNAGFRSVPDNKKILELEADIANAYACAKEWVPDYSWDEKRQTASQAVWACGTSYEGTSKACDDWRRLFKYFAPEQYASLLQFAGKQWAEFNALTKKLEEEEKLQKET